METIKEKKKADLKQILNSLINKWWKPRGKYEMEYQYMLTISDTPIDDLISYLK